MATMTQHDAFVKAITNEGGEIVPKKTTRRTTVMTHPRKDGRYYYIGHSGSLRVGHNKVSSLVVGDTRKVALLMAGGYGL